MFYQLLRTKCFEKYRSNDYIEDTRCRICNSNEETVFHILSNCSALVSSLYVTRHDNALKCFVWPVLEFFGLISNRVNWFSHREVKPYYFHDSIELWWDIPEYSSRTEYTDRPLRPDAKIKIERGEERKIYIIEMTVPWISLREEKYNYKRGKYVNILNNLKLDYPDNHCYGCIRWIR